MEKAKKKHKKQDISNEIENSKKKEKISWVGWIIFGLKFENSASFLEFEGLGVF